MGAGVSAVAGATLGLPGVTVGVPGPVPVPVVGSPLVGLPVLGATLGLPGVTVGLPVVVPPMDHYSVLMAVVVQNYKILRLIFLMTAR